MVLVVPFRRELEFGIPEEMCRVAASHEVDESGNNIYEWRNTTPVYKLDYPH